MSCFPATRCAPSGSQRPISTTHSATPGCAACSATRGRTAACQSRCRARAWAAVAVIYVTELLEEYGVHTLIRVGSCGAMRADLELLDVVLATSACTDSAMNRVRFRGIDFAPTADFGGLRTAYDIAVQRGIDVRVGPIASWDAFYAADPTLLMQLADYGVLAVEMETAALFTIAAGAGARALTICQVVDSVVTGEHTPAEQRERGLATTAELALETVHALAVVGGAA